MIPQFLIARFGPTLAKVIFFGGLALIALAIIGIILMSLGLAINRRSVKASGLGFSLDATGGDDSAPTPAVVTTTTTVAAPTATTTTEATA